MNFHLSHKSELNTTEQLKSDFELAIFFRHMIKLKMTIKVRSIFCKNFYSTKSNEYMLSVATT